MVGILRVLWFHLLLCTFAIVYVHTDTKLNSDVLKGVFIYKEIRYKYILAFSS